MKTPEYTTVNPTDNPRLTQQLIEEALTEPRAEHPADVRTLRSLPVTSVRLPGGYESRDGMVYDVEVRELTGEDEEALAKAPTVARVLMTILNRATVRIGDEKATPKMLDDMLAGDRETVLLQIRKATYGAQEEFILHCIECSGQQKTTVDLDTDVTIKTLEDPNDRRWTMHLRVGEVQVQLPDGSMQRKVAGAQDKTVPELNTLLISECLVTVNGSPSLGLGTARSLGLADRQAIIEEIAKRQPGPELGEVVKQCETCSADIPIPLNLAQLFHL